MAGSEERAPWRGLYQYWLDHHVEGVPPGRRDIDPPVEIPRLVKDMILVALDPQGMRYRLIGSSVAAFMKVDITGKLVAESAWASQTIRSDWRRLLEVVAESQRPQLVITKLPAAVQAFNYSLVLPLIGQDGRTEMLLIGVFSGGDYVDPGTPLEGLITHEVAPY
jgi:hypothetical protein